MGLLQGLSYNLRGLSLGLKTPKLLWLGLIRFAAVIFITVLAVGFIVAYHLQLVDLVWSKPASPWLVWLWHLVAWLLVLLLTGVAALISYLSAQILFSVLIMDQMSRITEKLISGRVQAPAHVNVIRQFGYLIRQEIPRAVIPVLLTLTLMVLSWATPGRGLPGLGLDRSDPGAADGAFSEAADVFQANVDVSPGLRAAFPHPICQHSLPGVRARRRHPVLC